VFEIIIFVYGHGEKNGVDLLEKSYRQLFFHSENASKFTKICQVKT